MISQRVESLQRAVSICNCDACLDLAGGNQVFAGDLMLNLPPDVTKRKSLNELSICEAANQVSSEGLPTRSAKAVH